MFTCIINRPFCAQPGACSYRNFREENDVNIQKIYYVFLQKSLYVAHHFNCGSFYEHAPGLTTKGSIYASINNLVNISNEEALKSLNCSFDIAILPGYHVHHINKNLLNSEQVTKFPGK